jgi:uncharacterized membrane protein (UPF0127 family)
VTSACEARSMFRVVACVLLLATACSSGPHAPPPVSPSPTSTLQFSPALIETDKGSVLFTVELAVTNRERSRGLAGRRSLGPTDGMAFLFFRPTKEGFWMKDTLIPLTVAFFDDKGRILKILDMAPCRAAPCHVYKPGVTYDGALEVNRGALQSRSVDVGDIVHLAP